MLKYFGLESQISLIDTLEIIYKYSIEVQKDRVEREKNRLAKKKISWKDSVSFPGLSGNLHLNHFANNGRRGSWKNCFTRKDKIWLTRQLRKHLQRFNYSVEY